MFRPDYLQAGDKVALISPAGFIEAPYIEHAVTLLRSWQLDPVLGKHVTLRNGYYAGTDKERLEDLQWAMDDENIKAIFCTRGGYGSMRIVEEADYSFFQGNPKWLIGFSDITVLLSKITSLGIECIHAPMPKSYQTTSPQALSKLKEFLFGNITSYELPAHQLNREGIATGELTGGNLCLLHSIRSTSIEHHSAQDILFIEDVGENLYAIDRMMQSFKLSGRLEDLQGMIVGGFSKIREDHFLQNVYEVIQAAVNDYTYPVCFNFPAGHITDNYPLLMGAKVFLAVTPEGTKLSFGKIR